jgi:hypothetical protein
MPEPTRYQYLTEMSIVYFDEGPIAATKLISKAYPEAQKSQNPS